ncbi:hypothetical protein R5R35_005608 [Gryllus longicercus]|uniref:Meiosis-specific nuclear structural protein 1 n=1 Tax=Gryllus longicercus TaxID=2509291 RepID=A0AAN9V3R1_9ORTH
MAGSNCRKERQWDYKMQCFTEQSKADTRERAIKYMDDKAESKRFMLRLHEERHEAEMEDRIMKAKEAEIVRRCELEQEERLAQQIDFMKRQELREIKLRQRLRENCVELRELERKLKAAYGTKELLAQCAEKKAAEALEKKYEKEAYDVLKDSWAKEDEKIRKMQKEDLIKRFQFRQELQDQLIEAEKKRQKAYYDFLQEKHLIDEITAKILEEDCKREEEKFLSQARAREEIAMFMKQREAERRKRKTEMEEEDKRYIRYLEQRAIHDEEVRRLMEEKKAKREDLRYKLGLQLYEQEMRKLEHTEMWLELREAQARSASEAQQRSELENELRRRLELREMSMLQKGDKEQKRREEEEDDRRWRDEMLAKFAEDDRLEQLTNQKRWQMQREYAQAIQKLMEDRRAARAEEKQLLLKEREQEECLEAQRRKMIEEERQRMLREHAVALLGHLPRGVLREEDLPLLGCDLANKMHQMKVSEGGPSGDNYCIYEK